MKTSIQWVFHRPNQGRIQDLKLGVAQMDLKFGKVQMDWQMDWKIGKKRGWGRVGGAL